MAKKSLFSTRDLYNMADRIVDLHHKFDLLLKFAKMEADEEMTAAYSGIVWELELLIETYGLREMVKIN
jgi:hypothetical protein